MLARQFGEGVLLPRVAKIAAGIDVGSLAMGQAVTSEADTMTEYWNPADKSDGGRNRHG